MNKLLLFSFCAVFLLASCGGPTNPGGGESDYECSDGIDNDNDGLIDFPDDPGCASALDTDESNTPVDPNEPPVIDSVSGPIVDGDQVTITGTFSAKTNSALLYLDGTEANIGDTIPGLNLGTLNYHIDGSRSYSGGVSMFADAAADNEGAYDRFIFDTPQSEVYFSYLTYIDAIEYGDPSIGPQLKFGRLGKDIYSHSGPGVFGATWFLPERLTMYLSGHPAQFGAKAESTTANWDGTKLANNWVRHEGYIKILSVEANSILAAASYKMYVETGETVHRFRGWPIFSFNDPTLESDAAYVENQNISYDHVLDYVSGDPVEYTQFILPFFKRKTTDLDIWVDDVYINSSPERVEVCDSPEWINCTNRVLQNPMSRTDNTIIFKYNAGHFGGSSGLYIYVVNENGIANAAGFPLE